MELNDYLYEVLKYEDKTYYFKYIISKKYLIESLILPENEFLKSDLSLRTSCLVKEKQDQIISTDFNNFRIFLNEKDFKKLSINFIEHTLVHYLLYVKSIHNYLKIIDFAVDKKSFYLKNYKIHNSFQLINLSESNPELKFEIDNLRLRRDTLIKIVQKFKVLIKEKDLEKVCFSNEEDQTIINLLKKDFK